MSVVQLWDAQGVGVTLQWDPPNLAEASRIAGYRLVYGPRSCTGVANCTYPKQAYVAAPTTVCTVSDIDFSPGVTNYFAIVAVGRDGSESLPSPEIPYSIAPVVRTPIGDLLANLTEIVVVEPANGQLLAPAGAAGTNAIPVAENAAPEADPGSTAATAAAYEQRPALQIVTVGQPATAVIVQFDAPPTRSCELQFSDGDLAWKPLLVYSSGARGERTGYYDPIDLQAPVKQRIYRLIVR